MSNVAFPNYNEEKYFSELLQKAVDRDARFWVLRMFARAYLQKDGEISSCKLAATVGAGGSCAFVISVLVAKILLKISGSKYFSSSKCSIAVTVGLVAASVFVAVAKYIHNNVQRYPVKLSFGFVRTFNQQGSYKHCDLETYNDIRVSEKGLVQHADTYTDIFMKCNIEANNMNNILDKLSEFSKSHLEIQDRLAFLYNLSCPDDGNISTPSEGGHVRVKVYFPLEDEDDSEKISDKIAKLIFGTKE